MFVNWLTKLINQFVGIFAIYIFNDISFNEITIKKYKTITVFESLRR